jgi:hypothetical protein
MKKEYDFSKLKELKNPYAGKKKAVGINLSQEVLGYFKELAEETGLPYQKLIDLYLLDCAKKRKKLTMKWVRKTARVVYSFIPGQKRACNPIHLDVEEHELSLTATALRHFALTRSQACQREFHSGFGPDWQSDR